ncbi:MAG TPA: hypothetical protein VE777_05745 [Gaiellales bacterium]|jgi:hypothetical protein|nr:hypothetical protein [Gaiellales bacterium]
MLRLPWPLRIVLGIAAAGFGIWAHSHHSTSHTWMEGELRKAIDAQIAPQTVSSVHCSVHDPNATCTFVVSGQTYRQHFHRDDSTWTPADQATPVSR